MSLLIHEVARRARLHVDTVRRLERRGLISSKRDINGWRRYRPDVVQILRRLYHRKGQEREIVAGGQR